MRMAAEAENALSDQLEDICRKSSKAGGHLSLDKWEIEETDLNEKCYRDDFLKKNKFESKKSIWDESEICSMCQAWQDIGDGFRFHLPEDIFSARPASVNVENKEKLGDIDIEEEDKEKNFCEDEKEKNYCEEETEADTVEGENQVTCCIFN